MNTEALKVVILGIVLTVLAFIVGSQAAESSREAYMTLAAVGALFFMLVIGKKCWWLLFILPPLLGLLPLGIMEKIPPAYALAPAVLCYWIIMWAMGYVRITWHGHRWIDFIFFVVMAYMAVSYYRHPVSVTFLMQLGIEAEMVGGEAYIFALGALIYYITFSIIPNSTQELTRVLKYAFIARCIVILIGLRNGPQAFPLGMVATALICYYPLTTILLSPWKSLVMLLGFWKVAHVGQRSVLAAWVVTIVFMTSVWKNLTLVLLIGAASLGVVYFASSQRLLLEAPPNVQRALSPLPGIIIEDHVRFSAEHSSEWRFVMWRWAFDPRSGLIKNYVWGDGCEQSVKEIQWDGVLLARGVTQYGDQQQYAERGVWHNGGIDLIHRIGYVGLILMLILQITQLTFLWRTAHSLLRTPLGFFFCIYAISTSGSTFGLYAGDGHLDGAMKLVSSLPLIKVLYTLLLKNGTIRPLFQRRIYTPLAIQDLERVHRQMTPAQ